MPEIKSIKSREILDSRGFPTIEVETELFSGIIGRASVPSGASTGSHEAHELRDNNKKRFNGKGVSNAVEKINTEINETISGIDCREQQVIDGMLISLDGTKNKSRLGANSILGVSLSLARAASLYHDLPLYKYLGGVNYSLPTPMMNIVNGGCHSNNSLNFQEFMIIPAGFDSIKSSIQAGSEIFHILKDNLNKLNLSISVGDEGGFSPMLSNNRDCLDLIVKSVEQSQYKIGKDIFIALDVASTEFYQNGKYILSGEKLTLNSDQLIRYYEELIKNYPIVSIEDGLSENDWDGWKNMTQHLGKKCQLVGDDLFVTNPEILKKGIDEGCANSVLIKYNQIGTLTETINAISIAKDNDFNTIISHRSGETEDTFIADLSVSMASGQIKTGSLSRSERICKYNQLIRIEEDNREHIQFTGLKPFEKFL